MNLQLKQLRKKSGMRQEDLAKKAGIVLRTYQTWERGENAISLDGAVAIAEALNCTLDELAGRDLDPQTYTDPRQAKLNHSYSTLSDDGKDAAAAAVSGMADAHIKKATPDVSGVVRKSVR